MTKKNIKPGIKYFCQLTAHKYISKAKTIIEQPNKITKQIYKEKKQSQNRWKMFLLFCFMFHVFI